MRVYIYVCMRVKIKKKKKNTIFVTFLPKYAVSILFGVIFLPFSLFFLFFFLLEIGTFQPWRDL